MIPPQRRWWPARRYRRAAGRRPPLRGDHQQRPLPDRPRERARRRSSARSRSLSTAPTRSGVDFDPQADRLRLPADGQNLRVNADFGADAVDARSPRRPATRTRAGGRGHGRGVHERRPGAPDDQALRYRRRARRPRRPGPAERRRARHGRSARRRLRSARRLRHRHRGGGRTGLRRVRGHAVRRRPCQRGRPVPRGDRRGVGARISLAAAGVSLGRVHPFATPGRRIDADLVVSLHRIRC